MSRPVAFYAPLKSPDHPVPSGDRTMARLLLRALARAGFDPHLASRLRGFEPTGEADLQRGLRDAGRTEAARLLDLYGAAPAESRPRLWFTYHCYYKAPDWIGPAVADGLGIPYVVAEGSRAAKRAHGPWAIGHRGAEDALDRARCVFAMTSRDAEALRRDAPPGQTVVDLLPFVDLAEWPAPPARRDPGTRPPRLLAVGMMRDGDKLASYRILADALARLPEEAGAWTLDIVGDGPAGGTVEALFAPVRDRVALRGAIDDRQRLAALYAASDLLVWPAVNEAYGMVLLEAQAMGCPVLAGRFGGVADVVRDGVTGILASPGDTGAFADGLAALLADPARLAAMGRAASRFVRSERGLDGAAATLAETLGKLLHGPASLVETAFHHPLHAEVLAGGEPRSTRDRRASFEADLQSAPQDGDLCADAGPVIPGDGGAVGKGIQGRSAPALDPLPLRFAPAGDDRKRSRKGLQDEEASGSEETFGSGPGAT